MSSDRLKLNFTGQENMEFDEFAAESKRQEIREALLSVGAATQALPNATIQLFVDTFVSVSPPEEPELTIGLITVSSLYAAPMAHSRKPGNIILNWRKLIDIVPDITLAGLGAATLPVAPALAVVLAGLYVWNKVWRGSLEEFTEIEATTILALWQNRNSENKIVEADGFTKTNAVRVEYSLPALTQGQYTAAVNRLVEMECVELEDGTIWLREWVKKKYS